MKSKQLSQITDGKFGSGIRKRFFAARVTRHIHLPHAHHREIPGIAAVNIAMSQDTQNPNKQNHQPADKVIHKPQSLELPLAVACPRFTAGRKTLPMSQLISWVAPRRKAAPNCCAALCDSCWSLWFSASNHTGARMEGKLVGQLLGLGILTHCGRQQEF